VIISVSHALAAVLGALLGVTLFVVVPNRSAARLALGFPFDRGPAARFLGGATWSPARGLAGRASWPLAALELHAEGLVLRCSIDQLAFLIPRIELPWSDIACVERRPTGVRILRADKPGASVLFQLHRDEVLHALRSYPVTLR
jgi:hypothetical protein